jgi:hypothetical protein
VLSVVAAARNDNHGGSLLRRMQLFVDCLDVLCARHRLAAELVLVEWNAPEDRAPLAGALAWAAPPRLCGVRIITVPHAIHRRFEHSDGLPLFQMIAKNAGIRRARGEFVLATNVDVLLSRELVQFLASGRLETGRLYRVERYDVADLPPPGRSIDDVLRWCAASVYRVNERDGSVDLRTGERHTIYLPWTKRAHLHTNASGDFQLMAASHWHELGGYPEFETYSMHLDSLLCYVAHFGGAREQVLADPARVYHFDHRGGWTPDEKRTRALGERLERAGVPQLDHATFDAWAHEMTRAQRPIRFNDDSWGLAGDALDEQLVVAPSWACSVREPATALAP